MIVHFHWPQNAVITILGKTLTQRFYLRVFTNQAAKDGVLEQVVAVGQRWGGKKSLRTPEPSRMYKRQNPVMHKTIPHFEKISP